MKRKIVSSDDAVAALTPTADDVLDVLRLTARLVSDVETTCADHERPEDGPFFQHVLVLQGLRQVLERRMRAALEFDRDRAQPFCALIVTSLDQVVAQRRLQ